MSPKKITITIFRIKNVNKIEKNKIHCEWKKKMNKGTLLP